ncbi:ARM repeat-containing protein [Trametes polyzona]|nr:ARM repeat-containing protein [Trametes polyzona]
MTVSLVDVPTLKAVKNSVIGNRTAKAALGRDEAYVAKLIECIHAPSPAPGYSSIPDVEIRVEAAHIIASLSYGSSDALRTLLRLDALQALVYAISMFQPSDPLALKAALTRALRALAAAVADAVGPSQWGLTPTVSDLRPEAKVALDYLFQPEVLDVYIPLLLDPSPQVNTAIAQLLYVAVRSPEHRVSVQEWCPPAERSREAKGKRGWERRDRTTSPSRHGGWMARTLTTLLQRKDVKLQEAVLAALACLVKDSEGLARRLARAPPGAESVLTTALNLAKSRNVDLQLAACLCATNILRASVHTVNEHPHVLAHETSHAVTIMHVLNRIINSDSASNQIRTKACFILYYLVADNRAFCQLAFERNCLASVANLINSITPTEKSPDFEEDEPESVSRLREAALTAVAAISLFHTDIRTAVTDDLRLVPAIQASLTNKYTGVRYAACHCARALSRAVSALRTNIVDTGLGLSVFHLFMKQDEDRQVMHAASTVICNILTNFSPLCATLLEQGVIPRLVQLLHAEDKELRLNALWAFKNLLYKAPPDLKQEVMNTISREEIEGFFNDPDLRLHEQTLHILRHVADGVEDVELLFSKMGGSDALLSLLATEMERDDEDVVLQAVFVVANIANSPLRQKDILSHFRILGRLRECLVDAKVEVRRPAVSCVLELARKSTRSAGYPELHEVGIDATLRHILEHTAHVSASPTLRFAAGRQMGAEDDPEVQDKARQALHWLEQAQLNIHDADMDL